MKMFRNSSIFFITAVLFLSTITTGKAGPTGGQVTSGTATINQSGTQTTINQISPQTFIRWQTYNTAANEGITYAQPGASAIALNQVAAGNPSILMGTLTSNGQVWLLNPSGILFGKGSTVNVGGLLASTLTMSETDFNNGNYHLTPSPTTSAVVNFGSIQGTNVALIAPLVYNAGAITANNGRILLDGSEMGIVGMDKDGLMFFVSQSGGSPQSDVSLPAGSVDSNLQTIATNRQALPAVTGLTVNPDTSAVLGGGSGTIINSGKLVANGGASNLSSNIVVAADQSVVSTPGSSMAAASTGAGPGGVIQVQAGNNIWSQQSAFQSSGLYGNITLTTPGTIQDTGSTFSQTGGGNFVLNNPGDPASVNKNYEQISLLAGGPSSGISLSGSSLTATSGNDSLENGIVVSTNGGLTANNGTNILGTNVNGITLFANGTGGTGLTLDRVAVVLNTGQDARILSEGFTNITNSKFEVENQGNLQVSGDNNVVFTDSTINQDHAGNATLFAGGTLTANGSTFETDETNNLSVLGAGGVSLTNDRFNITNAADTTISSGAGLTMSGVNFSADHDGAVRIYSVNDMNISGSSFAQSYGGDLWFASNGNMAITGTKIMADHLGDLNNTGNLSLLSSLNMNLTNDTISLTQGLSSLNNALRISSDGALTVANSSVIGDQQDNLTIFSEGNLDLNNTKVTHTNGSDLRILSQANLTIENGSRIEQQNSGNAVVSSNGALTVSNSAFNIAFSGNTVLYSIGAFTVNSSTFSFLEDNNESFLADGGSNLTMTGTRITNQNIGATLISTLGFPGNLTLSGVTIRTSEAQDTDIVANSNLAITNSTIAADHDGNINLVGHTVNTSGSTITNNFGGSVNTIIR